MLRILTTKNITDMAIPLSTNRGLLLGYPSTSKNHLKPTQWMLYKHTCLMIETPIHKKLHWYKLKLESLLVETQVGLLTSVSLPECRLLYDSTHTFED